MSEIVRFLISAASVIVCGLIGFMMAMLFDKAWDKYKARKFSVAIDIEQMANDYLEAVKRREEYQPYNNDETNYFIYDIYKTAAYEVMNEINKKIAEKNQNIQSNDDRHA